jgi:paraquat-inducible protein A
MTPRPIQHHDLIACHECDLLQRLPRAEQSARVRCRRCGCILHRSGRDVVKTPLALGLTALVLFVFSNSYPLLEFELNGYRDSAYLVAGIRQLYSQQMPILATTVLFTTIVAPLLHVTLLIYVYLPLALRRRPPAFPLALRLLLSIVPWSMLEIFLLGVVVAGVKLAEQATLVPGPAAVSLALLVVVLAAASTQVHPHHLWERVA